MSCNKFEKFGLLYFYKELGTQETQEFEKHLKGCEVCRHKFKELEDTVNLYKELPEEEPSPAILKEVLERAKRKKFQLKALSVEIFKSFVLPRYGRGFRFAPTFVGVGVVIILVIAGYFFSQRPKPYLEWDNGMESKIEVIEDDIYNLHKEAGILGGADKVFLNLENGIGELREKIKNLEKKLQTW